MSNHGAQSNRVFRRDAKYCVSTHNRKTALLPKMFKTFLVVRFFYFNCIGIFILFMRVTGWHGLFPSPTGIEDRSWEGTPHFPSWEGSGVGPFPSFHEDKGREISVNISQITDLPTP